MSSTMAAATATAAAMATAAVVDQASSSAVRAQNAALDSFTSDYADRPGSTVTAMTYHGTRLPNPPIPFDPREVTMEAPTTSSVR